MVSDFFVSTCKGAWENTRNAKKRKHSSWKGDNNGCGLARTQAACIDTREGAVSTEMLSVESAVKMHRQAMETYGKTDS